MQSDRLLREHKLSVPDAVRITPDLFCCPSSLLVS
jgi:hypothetical protein